MAQTATMTKLRGRHYAARARAAQISAGVASAPAPPAATVSNESLVRRLNSTRFRNSIREGGTNTAAKPTTTRGVVSAGHPGPARRYATPTRSSNSDNSNTRPRGSQRPLPAASAAVADWEMELVKGMSDRLETGLNEDALSAILGLLKRGEHPDAVVAVVTSLAQRPR